MKPIICTECGLPIVGKDYDERHWGSDGESEYHAGCCPECKDAEREGEN